MSNPHLASKHRSMMAELLERRTKMKVVEVKEGMEVEPNRVYVISPNKDMALRNDVFHLLEPVEIRGRRRLLNLPMTWFQQGPGQHYPDMEQGSGKDLWIFR